MKKKTKSSRPSPATVAKRKAKTAEDARIALQKIAEAQRVANQKAAEAAEAHRVAASKAEEAAKAARLAEDHAKKGFSWLKFFFGGE